MSKIKWAQKCLFNDQNRNDLTNDELCLQSPLPDLGNGCKGYLPPVLVDHGNSYKENNLIGGGLQFQKFNPF